jgi:galactonate dehydratase
MNVSRRSVLASAAGALLVREASGQEPKVEDRGTSIRITALKAMPVAFKAYLKIETSAGIAGWGEVTGLEPKVACALAESLVELLKGENPTRIEHLWQKLYRSHRDMRGGPFMTHVISAIDMALWDITGRLYGVPVHRLLGGPVRDRIRVYPHAKAQKVATGGPKPFAGDPDEIKGILGRIDDARRKVGPDGTVIYDAHCCVPPPLLIQLAGEMKPSDVLFIEEPAVPGNIEVFKRLKAAIKIPLATGERDRTIWEVLPYLQERCIDILQPDCGHTGGISQMKKIAALAEAYTVPLAPHCTMSMLGLTASLHAVATIPNFLIHECYTDGHAMPLGVARASWTVDKSGYASIPDGPGLGVDIDEALIESMKDDPKYKFKWPLPRLGDGSVTDY